MDSAACLAPSRRRGEPHGAGNYLSCCRGAIILGAERRQKRVVNAVADGASVRQNRSQSEIQSARRNSVDLPPREKIPYCPPPASAPARLAGTPVTWGFLPFPLGEMTGSGSGSIS